MYWTFNQNLPWASYQAFMTGSLIALDNLLGVRPVVIGETWIPLFDKCVLKLMGYESTHACKYGQICADLKAGINWAVHGV